ncbi:hypothetical protein BDZ91DRAFT_721428 [Kalaharituber pfeilii]|nr:hypothetical protein BDZ91DRAFT_721428 [Kalaharituber pfeilii]
MSSLTATPSITATTSTSSLLADPILAQFLAPSFSVVSFLNSTLPPLAPPSTALPTQPKHDSKAQLQQQLSQPTHISNNPNALPLLQIHPKATALLSALDIQTHKLIVHMQNLTDEILRVAPRLSYEVEVLRGGVVSLGEDLERVGSQVATFNPTSVDEDQSTEHGKPDVLKKLETLSTIRARLEEVIEIFGNAMNWPPPVPSSDNTNIRSDNNLGVHSPLYHSFSPAPSPPPFIKEMNKASNAMKATNKSVYPAAEVSYLLASSLIAQARERIDELRLLAGVFKGTVEENSRMDLIDELDKRVKEAEKSERLRENRERGSTSKEERMAMPLRMQKELSREDTSGEASGRVEAREDQAPVGVTGFGVGRDGYYGLINQLQRMRGMG